MANTKINRSNPPPLAKRICECGCGHQFQPRRSDQRYLDYKHTNYAYNHGARKARYAEEKDVTKHIRKNDRILEKYFNLFNGAKAIMNFTLVKAEGFKDEYYSGVVIDKLLADKVKYITLYKYRYRLFRQGDINYIEIQKI